MADTAFGVVQVTPVDKQLVWVLNALDENLKGAGLIILDLGAQISVGFITAAKVCCLILPSSLMKVSVPKGTTRLGVVACHKM